VSVRQPCARCGGDKEPCKGSRYCAGCRSTPEELREIARQRTADWYAQNRERQAARDGICGGDVDPLRFEVDHIVPISQGGDHSYPNVQAAHPRCNKIKGARVPEEVHA
jgi:5-methylcytosine-specific restriction endonuclease McrA